MEEPTSIFWSSTSACRGQGEVKIMIGIKITITVIVKKTNIKEKVEKVTDLL